MAPPSTHSSTPEPSVSATVSAEALFKDQQRAEPITKTPVTPSGNQLTGRDDDKESKISSEGPPESRKIIESILDGQWTLEKELGVLIKPKKSELYFSSDSRSIALLKEDLLSEDRLLRAVLVLSITILLGKILKVVDHGPTKSDFQPEVFQDAFKDIAGQAGFRLFVGTEAEFACLYGNVISPGSTPEVEGEELNSPNLYKIGKFAASTNLPYNEDGELVLSFSSEAEFADKVAETASNAADNLMEALHKLLVQVETAMVMANVEYGKAMRRRVKIYLLLDEINRALDPWLSLQVVLKSIEKEGVRSVVLSLRDEIKLSAEEKQAKEKSEKGRYVRIPSYQIHNFEYEWIDGTQVRKEVEPRSKSPTVRFDAVDDIWVWTGEGELPEDYVEESENEDQDEDEDDGKDAAICSLPAPGSEAKYAKPREETNESKEEERDAAT